MDAFRLFSTPGEVTGALVDAADWSTEFDFCTPAVDSRLGQWPFWCTLLKDERRLRHAFVALDGLRSEPHALEQLHRIGALRLVPAADGSFRSHVFRFRRAGQVRIFVGSGALVPEGLMAPLEAITFWSGGDLEGFAAETDNLFARAKQLAHVPEPEELGRYATDFLNAAPQRDALTEIGARYVRRTAFDGEGMELEVVTRARQVREAIEEAKQQLVVATVEMRQTVGFHGGGGMETVYWSSPLGIWSLFKKLENRYWNCFGITRPDSSKSLAITVEVNPPLEGLDRKMGGAIAREAGSGRQFLVHRGRIGGGQAGIGAELFWSRFRGGVQMSEPGADDKARVVVVGEIGAISFPRDVGAFVHEVARIKRAAA